LRTLKVCLFSKGRPQVKGAAYCLFRPIVEIVAKGRSDLRFGFDGSDQCPFTDNKEIPFFGWSEETGKFDGPLAENVFLRNPRMRNKFGEEINKSVHLGTAGYCATRTLVCFATFLLFLPLGSPRLPVMSNRFGGVIRQVLKNSILVHGVILSGSWFVFQKADVLHNLRGRPVTPKT
jgi:hypothetical protein